MRRPASCSGCKIMGHTRPTCKLEADRRRRICRSLDPATPDEIIQMKEEMTRAFTESAKGIAWREQQLLVAERARQQRQHYLERQRLENVRRQERNAADPEKSRGNCVCRSQTRSAGVNWCCWRRPSSRIEGGTSDRSHAESLFDPVE